MSKKADLTYLDWMNLLEEIKFNHPNLRIGQIIENARPEGDLYYTSDQDMLDGLQKFNNELSNS